MKKYKFSIVLVVILCFSVLPAYTTISGTENVVATNKMLKNESLEKLKKVWAEDFNNLVKIESLRLSNLNISSEKKQDTYFLFDDAPEYGKGYKYTSDCSGNWDYHGLTKVYATMLGCESWKGDTSGCQAL